MFSRSAVPGKTEKEEIGPATADFLDQRAAAIGRPVIYQQNAGRRCGGFFQIGGEPLLEPREVFPLVIDRYDNGKLIGGSCVHGLRSHCKDKT